MSNGLLDALPRAPARRLIAGSSEVVLPAGLVLVEADAVVAHAYFPLTALIAMTAAAAPHESFAIALVGNEGMLGLTLLLGTQVAPLRSCVLGTGTALRMPAAQFRQALRDIPSLSRIVRRYCEAVLREIAQSAACGRFHQVEARLARLLLLACDRSAGKQLQMTHALLAQLLGVRRSAVSIAAAGFQRDELIRYRRGAITIVSRAGLEHEACGCYTASGRNPAS
ncbi:MAG: helix-turn-helix domain-containing protein [Gammaproteobacteria bacterium]